MSRLNAIQRLNVRWKFTLWYGFVLTLIVIGFAACTYASMRAHLIELTDEVIVEELEELGLEVRLASDRTDLLRQLTQRFAKHATCDFIIRSTAGELVFVSDRLRPVAAAQFPQFALGSLTGDHFLSHAIPPLGPIRVGARTVQGTGGSYTIQVITTAATAQDELQALLWTWMVLGPLAILAAIGGGYFLARYALAPVDAMARTAERITANHLSERLPILNGNDELGQLARTLNAMIDRLQKAVDELRRFTVDAAHELRTPLAILRTEAEIALRQPRSAAEYRAVVEGSLQESVRLTALADQLLLLCRHDGGILPHTQEEIPGHALLADVVDKMRLPAEQKQLAIVYENQDEFALHGDDIQLSRVFFNLLDNAIKYTPSGGTITIRVSIEGSLVRLVIQDTGTGIAPADLPKVCDRFYRGHEARSRAQNGVGLGLAICKAILTAHGATMKIESQLQQGTQVTLEFRNITN